LPLLRTPAVSAVAALYHLHTHGRILPSFLRAAAHVTHARLSAVTLRGFAACRLLYRFAFAAPYVLYALFTAYRVHLYAHCRFAARYGSRICVTCTRCALFAAIYHTPRTARCGFYTQHLLRDTTVRRRTHTARTEHASLFLRVALLRLYAFAFCCVRTLVWRRARHAGRGAAARGRDTLVDANGTVFWFFCVRAARFLFCRWFYRLDL